MENKYKKRAEEIVNQKPYLNNFLSSAQGFDIMTTLMSELAQEVETETKSKRVYLPTKEDLEESMNKYSGMYTKQQVEEALERQRNLCAISAKTMRKRAKWLNGYYIGIDKDSILNAKLDINT